MEESTTPDPDEARENTSSTPADDEVSSLSTERATIYDVAAESRTSVATVSRVTNGADNVADATRERVEAAVKKLRYRALRSARSLAEQETRVLAVALPSFITPFHNELMKGIRVSLQDRPGFDLLVHDLGSDDPSAALGQFLAQGTVDALLVDGAIVGEAAADELRAWHAPVVLVGEPRSGIDSFTWDDREGARLAVAHLAEQGHERIGMIRSHAPVLFQEERVGGYRQALEAADLDFDESLVVSGRTEKHGGFSEEAGYEAMQELLEEADPPVTAVFCSSDVHAVGAWAALREAGRRVPEDIALVGYDDVKTSRFLGLSSVAQHMHEVGERTVERMLYRLANPDDEERRAERVTPHLEVRRSSKRDA